MIPKVIHYCWFGGNELPPLARKCIESWKKYCPDFKIIEWNEQNYDCTKIPYMREAYETKKWAFVSDYARLDIIYQNGGVYLDVDVEVIRNFDEMLDCSCFLAVESTDMIATGLGFGAEKENENIKRMMEQYEGIHFKLGEDLFDTLPCPHRNTLPFQEMGFIPENRIQNINGAVIYPAEYFCPLNCKTNQLMITGNTATIHHFSASWKTPEEREFLRKIEAYKKQHGKIRSLLYKNYLEYNMYYVKINPTFMVRFVKNKIKRKWNRWIQKL